MLLEAYDRHNRLAIDAVYAQFSPTLDDYYLEELLVVFPEPVGLSDTPEELRPEIVLTRTVPGQQPKSVRGAGAPFPLAETARLAAAALAASDDAEAQAAGAQLGAAAARVWPVQQPRTQLIQLRVLPGGADVLAVLAGRHAVTR